MFISLCFLLATVVMGFGVVSMQNRGVTGDDILAAMTMGGAFAVTGVLLFALALKVRRTRYFDRYGEPVAADGSSLAFMMMGYQQGTFGDNDNNDDGQDDYGGDDFD